MRITKRDILITISSLLLAAALIAGCISLSPKQGYNFPLKRTSAPTGAFVLVEVTQEMMPTDCKTKDENIVCESLLKELPDLTVKGSGSGMMVMSDMGPGILTAAHVCEKDTPDTFIHSGVKITILTEIKIRVHSPVHGSFDANIMRTDTHKDLCFLKPSKIFTNPVPLAKAPPKLGDKVYAIAAPFGISGQNLSLIFNGYFSGTRDENRFYTIPTRPGSSGAAVLNTKWEVVGVLHTAFRDLENVGIGTGLVDIREFLYSSVETIVEKPFWKISYSKKISSSLL